MNGQRFALVVGGAGGMGSWFRRALTAAGWDVAVVDPAGDEDAVPRLADVADLDRFAFAIVAVPLGATAGALDELAARRPRGLVVEVASVQGHLEGALGRARERGIRVVALHPMFGPGRPVPRAGEEPLRFVLAAQADAAAEEAAVGPLVAAFPARVFAVPFAHHDALMSWVLGWAHLTNLLFGRALAGSGLDPAELAAAASTTFARQAEVARALAGENPDLYLDIQRLNPHRAELYAAARAALAEIEGLVAAGDREGFRALFAANREFL